MSNITINTNTDTNYQCCTRCICDTTMPGITFDNTGECNFCKLHDKLDKAFSLDEKGQKKLQRLVSTIKKSGKNKKYDCVVGISGGRDSMYTLYYTVKILGLRPLAVHFNDGFGNPIAGENMRKGTKILGVDLITITSDWRESKDLKIAFLKASVPESGVATDIGIATALYGVAAKENIKYVLIGQSFRTEGISPLSWNYMDGKYLKSVHKLFGTVPLRKWTPNDPGFHLDLREVFYYVIMRGIKTIPILYLVDYVRKDVDAIISKELEWVNTGAHYFDDLWQSLATNLHRTKFNIDRRLFNYSALVRSGQMTREEALERTKEVYVIEDPKVIDLCIKRLGLTREEYESIIDQPVKTFRNYNTNYSIMRWLKFPIWVASKLNILPGTAYDKYFNCGK
ncbi:MAG: N-acetyl sugar amidotransferase [Cytophagales bacterium]|nr:MAG: N-acetyl sugar amidotransferase [Cytophagales bacterium]